MSSPKKKFVEYLGSEMGWPDLRAILSYLSANGFLRVVFFFFLNFLNPCPLEGQLLETCTVVPIAR